jgi:ribosomal protein S18 acetylase RimI-like enzyme
VNRELRPPTPARRPGSARPREDAEPVVEPPSPGELEHIERHLCSLPRESGAHVVSDAGVGALVVSAATGSYVAMPRWSHETWRDALELASARLRGEGAWPSLLVADRLDRPVGLSGALPAAGWRRVHEEEVLWVGRASVVPHLDPGLRIEAVQPGKVADHEALERAIFGHPAGSAPRRGEALASAIASGTLRAFVVRLHDEPVAVARLSQGEGVAGLYGIGVAASHRRQGLGTLVTTIATRAGLALGNRVVWLSVEPGNEAARRLYARLGYARAFGWARWMRVEG